MLDDSLKDQLIMSPNQYLESLLKKYEVPSGPNSPALQAYSLVKPVIQRWAGQYLSSLDFSGSFAKGTGVLGGTDIDIFITLSSTTPETLAQIYTSLFEMTKNANWSPRIQNVSIGAIIGSVKVDLVPGKIQPGYQNYTSLYKRKSGSWTQTNIKTHIDTVKKSNRIKEIRLAKLWRQQQELDFPSFYLELAVIEALSGKKIDDIANNFWMVLDFFSGKLINTRLVDPSNSNNVISDDLAAADKIRIASAAVATRKNKLWEQVVW